MWFQKQLPLYLQHEKTECAQACIAMLASYFGLEMDLASIRQRFGHFTHGLSLSVIRMIFLEMNFNARALKVPLACLNDLPSPCLLHWELDHFVVLKKAKKNRFWIHDPAVGLRVCGLDEMSNSFSGVALTIEPGIHFETVKKNRGLSLFDLFRLVSGLWRLGLFILFVALLVELGALIQAFFIKYVTDSVMQNLDWVSMRTLAWGMLGLLPLFIGLDYLKGRLHLFVSIHLKNQFASNAMKHLCRLPLSYFEQRQVGQLQLMFQSLEACQKQIGEGLIQGAAELVLLLLILSLMFCFSAGLTALMGLEVIFYASLRLVCYQQIKSYKQMAFNQHGKVASLFLETLQIMPSLKAYAKELFRWMQWNHAYVQALNAERQVALLQLGHQTMNQLLMQLGSLSLIFFGVYLMGRHALSLGMFMAFLSYRQAFVSKIDRLFQRVLDYHLTSVELTRLQDLVDHPPEEMNPVLSGFKVQAGTLRLEQLSFQYDERQGYILEDVNLWVEQGEKLAIVGESGCGKSTLLKLMMGLLTPQKGRIEIGGTLLTQQVLQPYRQMSASVLQEDRLMSGSLRDNIAFFEDHVDPDWLEEVSHLAAIHEWIHSLPMKYETRLGELGTSLSGGQKQRVLLARALYKRPRFLFLDEATSHLDVKTERQVNTALKQLAMTQVIVAHRQETIAMADRVFKCERFF